MNDADYIVVGSGHNGLACALKLAQAGHKVLVLEQADQAGGASKSGEVTIPGFTHDLYATNIGLFLGSQIYQEMKTEFHQNGFDIAVSDQPFASVFPDGDGIGVYTDAQKTIAQFQRHSNHDADSWKALLKFFDETAPHFLPLLQMPLPSWPAARQLYRMWRALGYAKTVELGSMILKSPRQFAEYWFENEKVQSLFIPWAFHLDFGPDVSGGAQFPFVEPPLDHRNGMAIAKGGISNLIQSMVKTLEKRGGQVLTQHPVEKVLVQNNRAVGVQLANGNKIHARKAVIGNITPTQLITKLLDQETLPSAYVERYRKFRYGPGTMMIHLALDGPLSWKAGEDYAKFAYVHIGPYVEDVARTYSDALNGELPASPLLVVGQQSAFDPSRAPEGKHTLWVQVRALPAKPQRDSLHEIGIGTWDQMKDAYADRVLKKLEVYAPNVTQQIIGRTVYSPRDLEVANPNLVGGDSVSGSHHLDQNFLFRPVPGWSRYKTPVDGLFLIGASTWPGGGLNATSGYLLAKQLLKA
ncbi:NAD(P)/FAD-dependent oxidoreductase [Brevibacillus invocatus]|uniref:Pyridine nucleotide-disulfide oxidoreductase domain-containing protein 2 n=1 Tax=Brevibacillus invocatus TaxID=173959 RepID=A0A3M8C6B8_9BACL|nr:NAD(P)/FAD-dependent oxidoreductase [Brevibacillus invocatus]RNB71246.1 NAD(P)/FAD-dependent oxidoreductase [Brevibacillus invocatus]